MSHKHYFVVPAQFVYRPYLRKWFLGEARAVLNPESPTRYLANDEEEWLAETLDHGLPKRLNIEVRVKPNGHWISVLPRRAFVPPDLYKAAADGIDVSDRTFDVFLADATSQNVRSAIRNKPREGDPFEMFEEYLGIPRTNEGILNFLGRWGAWSWEINRSGRLAVASGPEEKLSQFMLVSPDVFWRQHDEFEGALTGKPSKWFSANPALEFLKYPTPPHFLICTSFCEETIRAVITIKHLQGSSFGVCKRHDCRTVFERTSRQHRLYCKPECAHLANVRKGREVARKTKPGPKRKGVQRATSEN